MAATGHCSVGEEHATLTLLVDVFKILSLPFRAAWKIIGYECQHYSCHSSYIAIEDVFLRRASYSTEMTSDSSEWEETVTFSS